MYNNFGVNFNSGEAKEDEIIAEDEDFLDSYKSWNP